MRAKQDFDTAIGRADYLLHLYGLIHDTRQRDIRNDWATPFKRLMHWPQGEEIIRVDGKGKNSILIFREDADVNREHFSHSRLVELLRAATVAAVSALDRYMHDIVVQKSWELLSRPEDRIPRDLCEIKVPVLTSKRALDRLRKDKKARPAHLVKKALQDVLHRQFTFQKPDDVKKAADMLGIKDFWTKVAIRMPGKPAREDVIAELKSISVRRNQIVHEADIVRKVKGKQITLRDVTYPEAENTVKYLKNLASAINKLIK